MKILHGLIRQWLLIMLFVSFIEVKGVSAQTCSPCEIPGQQRTQRLNQANQSLQQADSQQNALRNLHCPWGVPASPTNAENEHLLYQFEWLTLYDDDLRMPLWVTYEYTKNQALANVAVRQDCFRRDNRLSNSVASFCEDYDEPLYDRGHMVPANDLKRGQSSMDNSFLFSNMAPQRANFNQKIWEYLERRVKGWARNADGIYVTTGAVFDKNNDQIRDNDTEANRVAPRNRVAVATHFYKIILKRRPNGIMDTISILLPHNNISHSEQAAAGYLNSKIVSIDEIEKMTGINFFPEMESNRQIQIEAGKATSLNSWFTF
jgi:endonuclease G, mitochondrial